MRVSFSALTNRASRAAAMVGHGTDCSAASFTVILPVPLLPVLSRILSTRYPSPEGIAEPSAHAMTSWEGGRRTGGGGRREAEGGGRREEGGGEKRKEGG
jgi:hypothetical protein